MSPQALHIQVRLPGTGTVEVELISSVSREKLLAPGCGPGSFLTLQRDRRRGAVPALCVHTRNQVGINSSYLSHVSLSPYVKLL